jgi:UDP-N-acetylmuramoyl-tripeptide--D-alanyl-D-alanine ligase
MIENLYKIFLKSTGVSTDTRTIQKGDLWFALKGPNFNANRFAEEALANGASYAVIDDETYQSSERTILVEDALKALQDLANHHRHQLDIPILAITGSNGKTTSKELVRDVLAKKFKVHATEGNLNNHIGVPLSLLAIDSSIEFAVIEMGANAQKEIGFLCEIGEPNFGMITNIGKAHLEGFGGLEGVFKGKTEMYDFLAKSGGKAFVNTNFPRLVEKLKRLEVPFITYPNVGDDLSLTLLNELPELELETSNQRFITTLTGGYNTDNIAAALCIGKYFGVPLIDGIEAVKAYDPDNNRSQLIAKGSNTIVLDAYNANPSSMKAALESFAKREAQKKVVILGDMLELGDDSVVEHRQLGEWTSALKDTTVHFCGTEIRAAHEGNPNATYWAEKKDLAKHIQSQQFEATLFLIKGSRGMSLETILEVL